MKPLIAIREIRCKSPRDALWVALADTAQLNQAIGNNPLDSEPIEGQTARYLVSTRLYGLRLQYEEQPFQWSRPERLSITRVFRNGPAFKYTYEQRITDNLDGGSLVTVRIEIAPRWALCWLFLWINTLVIANKLARQVSQIDNNIQRGADPYGGAEKPSIDSFMYTQTTTKLVAALEQDELDVGRCLAQFVADAPDVEVTRIRPFELADQLDANRRTMVSVCLKAVVAGMLDLNWDIICPSCRTVASQINTLADLEEEVHCHLCDISIHVDLDRAVEATFRPTSAVRKLDNRPYCIGGPFRTPHVIAQADLPAGGKASLQAPEETGRYRLFVRGGASASIDVAEEGESAVDLEVSDVVHPAEICIAPRGSLGILNRVPQERHVKVEHLQWASLATTAHYVSAIESFRRLFSAEVLRPGQRVKVSRVALVFTDLTGSTAMYSQLGDAMAYRFVQDHFAALKSAISAHDGTIVKTIGDAIMAVFAEERAAVQATIAMQRAFQQFILAQAAASNVQLCVGMFVGPCYLVHVNSILDYFGQTVNIASRLQCEARGGQIILPDEIAKCSQANGWLTGARVTESFFAELKGLSEPLGAVRMVVDDGA